MSQKFDLQFSVQEGQRFSPKIWYVPLALIPTAYTHLIIKLVILQTKFAYIMQISYHLAIVHL